MSVHTLGEAWKLGWRVRVGCYFRGEPYKPGHRHRPILCDTTAELDLKTLAWTRGEHSPIDALRERLRLTATLCSPTVDADRLGGTYVGCILKAAPASLLACRPPAVS